MSRRPQRSSGIEITFIPFAAAGLSARLDFPLDDIEDIRTAVDEASLMLLPEPERALRHCAALLNPGGRLYFTQTIQLRPSRGMEWLKPMLKRLTSIDFGRVTYEDAFKAQLDAAGLRLEEFTVLSRHGSRASCLAVATTARLS